MSIYVIGSKSKKFLPLDGFHKKFLIDEKHEGDNIDYLNPWYCELTGLYYMWKHDEDDIVGLEHYRRYLTVDGRTPIRRQEAENYLKKYDVLCVKVNYPQPKGRELRVFASTEPLVLTQQNREA